MQPTVRTVHVFVLVVMSATCTYVLINNLAGLPHLAAPRVHSGQYQSGQG